MPTQNNLTPAAQIEEGYATLRFCRDLEARFEHYYNDRYLFRLRVASLVAAGIFSFFGVYNYVVIPSPVGEIAAFIQLAFVVPLLCLMWWATYLPIFRANTVPLFLAALIIAVGGLLAILVVAHTYEVRYRYEGFILITMYVYFLSGMRFRLACSSAFSIFLLYVVCDSFTSFPVPLLVENSFYLFSVNLIGVLGCYTLEYALRESFLNTLMLEDHAQRDGLTGIANRRYLESQMQRLWKQAQRDKKRIAVAFFDLDYFKSYNDNHGHLAGDECLKKIARTLSLHARRPLDIAARYGGEEFVLVWYEPEPSEQIFDLAENTRAEI